MNNFITWIDQLNWGIIVILCATLGLAPFTPPHFVEKLLMLFKGTLIKPIDWFDFFMHGFPWALLLLKTAIVLFHKT